MATWLFVALWIIWALWTISEAAGFIQLCRLNNNKVYIAILGEVSYTKAGKLVSLAWFICSVLWLCYNFV